MTITPTILSEGILDMLAEASDKFGGSPSQEELAEIVQQAFDMVRAEHKHKQMAGIARSRYLGGNYGRPKKPKPKNWLEIFDGLQNGEITRTEAAKQLRISASTVGKWIKEERERQSNRPKRTMF